MSADPADAEPEAARLARAALTMAETARATDDLPEAERWLERCRRLMPQDHYIALQLALVSLGRDVRRAESLFATVAQAHDLRDAWCGLAAARIKLGDPAGAAAALAAALSRHALAPQMRAIADPIAQAAGAAGWCGLTGDGQLAMSRATSDAVEVRLAGRLVHPTRLPQRWTGAGSISITAADRHLLGSPLNVAAIRRLEGLVEAWEGGLRGWAWYPGNPDLAPELTIGPASARPFLRVTATAMDQPIADAGPLPMQRRFAVPAEILGNRPGLLHVRGRDGQDLLGSPLDPRFEQRGATAGAAAIAHLYPGRSPQRKVPGQPVPAAIPADLSGPFPPPASDRRRRPADVVVPVHGNATMALACLESVLDSLPPKSRVVVIDDASPDPDLAHALDRLAATRRIRLIRQTRNLGFPASANAAIAACPGRDIVLLNSDTLVPPRWLERLRDAAYSAEDIGTVTPLSNNATILSFAGAGDGMPDLAATTRLDRLAERANGATTVAIPVGVGFCLYIRRDCLDDVGLLRADLFAQGYGEETDFCLRARPLGWRHLALPGLFVAHGSGKSFSRAGRHLQARNEGLLHRLHPGYARLIADFVAADPLADARRRLELARWRAARPRGAKSVILVTHNDGGGIEQRVIASVAAHEAAGRRAIVLRPARLAGRRRAVVVCDGTENDFPDLQFALPDEIPALSRLLRGERPAAVEVHSLLDHHHGIYQLLKGLGAPYEVHIHDYPWFCQRIALVGVHERYCGEPEPSGCEACVADAGRLVEEDIAVAALLNRSATFLAAARRVVTPSEDAASRMRRHFPELRPVAVPHEDDAALQEPPPSQARNGRCLVCVVGAIGVHKGYNVLLACARDAASRGLPLDFVLVGTSIDDGRLIATGRIFVTGKYQRHESVGLIRSQNASLALLPSIWPETWCLGLTEIWRAGLRAVAFDFGAPAERIRRNGWGVLLPSNLSPRGINNVVVASVGLSRHESLSPRDT